MPKIQKSSSNVTTTAYQNQRVFHLQDTLIKTKVLKEFLEELKQEQRTELSIMTSEITFYESTLTKLKSAVKIMRKTRKNTVKEYISDKITVHLSNSAKALSVNGCEISNNNDLRNSVFIDTRELTPRTGKSLIKKVNNLQSLKNGRANNTERLSSLFKNRYSKPEVGLFVKSTTELDKSDLASSYLKNTHLNEPSFKNRHFSRNKTFGVLPRHSRLEQVSKNLGRLKTIKSARNLERRLPLTLNPSLKHSIKSTQTFNRYKFLNKSDDGQRMTQTPNSHLPSFHNHILGGETFEAKPDEDQIRSSFLNSSNPILRKRALDRLEVVPPLDETEEFTVQTKLKTQHKVFNSGTGKKSNIFGVRKPSMNESQGNPQNQTTLTFFSKNKKKSKFISPPKNERSAIVKNILRTKPGKESFHELESKNSLRNRINVNREKGARRPKRNGKFLRIGSAEPNLRQKLKTLKSLRNLKEKDTGISRIGSKLSTMKNKP